MIDFKEVAAGNADAIMLIGELNAFLIRLIGNDGSGHVNYDDFAEQGAAFLVGYAEGQPVCCAGIRHLEEGCGEVKRVYARPNQIGAGSQLMAAIEQTAARIGYHKLKLECRTGNMHAIDFYKRNGYRVCENYAPYIGVADAVCLEKAVGADKID